MEEEVPAIPYSEWSNDDTARMRRRAYSDPDTGSDRYFAKAACHDALNETEDADAARQAGLDRVAEIKAAYPYRFEPEGSPE